MGVLDWAKSTIAKTESFANSAASNTSKAIAQGANAAFIAASTAGDFVKRQAHGAERFASQAAGRATTLVKDTYSTAKGEVEGEYNALKLWITYKEINNAFDGQLTLATLEGDPDNVQEGTSLNQSKAQEALNKGGAYLFINGINTGILDHLKYAKHLAKAYSKPFVGIYNCSGFKEGALHAMGIKSGSTGIVYDRLVSILGAHKAKHIDAHSDGSQITAAALWTMFERDPSSITGLEIDFFGSQVRAAPQGPKYLKVNGWADMVAAGLPGEIAHPGAPLGIVGSNSVDLDQYTIYSTEGQGDSLILPMLSISPHGGVNYADNIAKYRKLLYPEEFSDGKSPSNPAPGRALTDQLHGVPKGQPKSIGSYFSNNKSSASSERDVKGKRRAASSKTTTADKSTTGYSHNMVTNPGPLLHEPDGKRLSATFRSGMYNRVVLTKPTILYRAGAENEGLKRFYTRTPPRGEIQARDLGGVKTEWIDPKTGLLTGVSPMETVHKVRVPAGTVIYEGPAGYQSPGAIGGGLQIVIPDPKAAGVVPVVESAAKSARRVRTFNPQNRYLVKETEGRGRPPLAPRLPLTASSFHHPAPTVPAEPRIPATRTTPSPAAHLPPKTAPTVHRPPTVRRRPQRKGQGAEPNVDAGALLGGLLRAGGVGTGVGGGVRERLTPALGFDPGGARLHTGPAAAAAARILQAEAFTIGSNVFFGAGRHDPHSPKGLGLLAHELAHVGQQTGGGAAFGSAAGMAGMEDAARTVGQVVEHGFAADRGVSIGRCHVDVVHEGAPDRDHAKRLDALAAQAVDEATRRLEALRMPDLRIGTLDVDVELDLGRMSDDECVDLWASAIVQAARTHRRAPTAHASGLQRSPAEEITPDDAFAHAKHDLPGLLAGGALAFALGSNPLGWAVGAGAAYWYMSRREKDAEGVLDYANHHIVQESRPDGVVSPPDAVRSAMAHPYGQAVQRAPLSTGPAPAPKHAVPPSAPSHAPKSPHAKASAKSEPKKPARKRKGGGKPPDYDPAKYDGFEWTPGIDKTSPEFRTKLLQMGKKYSAKPEDPAENLRVANNMAQVMSLESGLNPKAQNLGNEKKGIKPSYATGLVQVMPANTGYLKKLNPEGVDDKAVATKSAKAKGLKGAELKKEVARQVHDAQMARIDALHKMGDVDQLEVVEEYYDHNLAMSKRRSGGKLRSLEDTYMVVAAPSAVGKPNDAVVYGAGSRGASQNPLWRDEEGKVTPGSAADAVRAHTAGTKPKPSPPKADQPAVKDLKKALTDEAKAQKTIDEKSPPEREDGPAGRMERRGSE